MKINQLGIELIKEFEGLHEKCGVRNEEQLVKAYYCPSKVLTIGHGTTGSRVKPDLVISKSTAEAWLKEDLEYFENAVKRLVKVKLNENQFSALVSFAYNCGEGALSSSTALKRLNKGDYEGCVEALQWWNKGTFGVLEGLIRRRKSEGELFNKPIKTASGTLKILHKTPLKPFPESLEGLIKQGITVKTLDPGEYQVTDLRKEGNHFKALLENGLSGYIYTGHCDFFPKGSNPGEVNLKVPFFSQLDNKFKPHSSCLATCVSMVCAFFGEKPSSPNLQMEDEFYLWLQKNNMNRFVHDNMTKVFQACGYKNRFKIDATWDEVEEHLRKGNPVIYSGTLTHSGHIIVIRGFNESKKVWYVNDPYGEYFSYGYNTNLTGENLEYSYGLLARKSMTGSRTTTWAHFPSRN